MERGVRVNAEYLGDYLPSAEDEIAGAPALVDASADYGPCLYLGPSGQRCDRRAVEGGFCTLHEAGATPPASSKPTAKRMAAIIGALAALLPWLTDFIRAIIHLFR
jgi:hypothetical protein